MLCPKCKEKLSTKRTTIENNTVIRERFCLDCNQRFDSIELLQNDFGTIKREYIEKIEGLRERSNRLKNEQEQVKNSIALLLEFVKD